MDYHLTDLQKKASDFFIDCYSKNQIGFLQAVCGAGKTEMTYQVILQALNEHRKVGYILPRVAVLKEVYKRFKKHFIETNIAALFEGNKQHDNANLVLSTPQQMIYFYKEFDLLIIDEVDAYPYANNPFLERLVKKATKQNAVLLYMSATINEAFQNQISKKEIRYHLVPSRYHKKPLVVPKFQRIRSTKHLNDFLVNWCNRPRQSLVFVPTIDIGIVTNEFLHLNGVEARFISSQSKDKNQIIQSFRNQEYRTLVTTTLLERGVTFPDIDCLLLWADHRVFTKETIIQIAGRVGRLAEFESGSILLLSTYITKAMKAARKEIIRMNQANEMQAV